MGINLLTLEPTKISRDLKGKYMLFYGLPKSGKTSLAVEFPKSLLVAFEKGYNALAGVMAVDAPKWSVMKEVLRELRKPEVQQAFDTVVIDTAAIAWEKCEEYICTQKDVEEIGDIPWGKGYKLCAKEFNSTLREITMLGYGLVFLTHSEEKPIPNGEDGETFIFPALEKRAYKIINGLVDVIGYIGIDNRESTGQRYIFTRSNRNIVAGSRFKYLSERIPLGYDTLVSSLVDAIERQGKEKGNDMIVDERLGYDEKTRPFTETIQEAATLWTQLLEKYNNDVTEMNAVIKHHFGDIVKLSATTERQQDIVELVIDDFKELLSK